MLGLFSLGLGYAYGGTSYHYSSGTYYGSRDCVNNPDFTYTDVENVVPYALGHWWDDFRFEPSANLDTVRQACENKINSRRNDNCNPESETEIWHGNYNYGSMIP